MERRHMFNNSNISVIGDIMLDKYVYCEIIGFSPEDDLTPKIRPKRHQSFPGGAANVAKNLRTIQCNCTLYGIIGNDTNGQELKTLLNDSNIKCKLYEQLKPTTTKTIYVTPKGRHIMRMDEEIAIPIPRNILKQIEEEYQSNKYDITIISDYNKGMITKELMNIINKYSKVVVDPKGLDYTKYGKVLAITPNHKEYGPTNNAQNTIVTQGPEGSILYNDKCTSIPVSPREVGDATGCGDSFIAGLAASLASGFKIEEACRIASAMAACAVDYEGTHAVTIEEVLKELEKPIYEINITR